MATYDGLLGAARPFLRSELKQVDPELPSFMSILCSAGAGECYHKHGTFLAHLIDVYRILRLWGAPDTVARCGLFHSAYSNSYVNLAIFEPDTSRDHVRRIIGEPTERLVHLFCVVPRHKLIYDDLHLRYTDAELTDHLAASEASLRVARETGAMSDASEQWRKKLRSLLPPEGVQAKHIRTGEPVAVSRRMVAVFILMTIADFSDQYTDYQDKLFSNGNGRLEYTGDNWAALWPGTGKPGLWLNAMSRLAALYSLILRDEELYMLESNQSEQANDRDDDLALPIPPVFDSCTKVLDPDDQKAARDLYWEAICSGDGEASRTVEELLRQCIAKNPFVGEPHLVLAQVCLNMERYEGAEKHAEQGLRLLLEWGSSWDKRISWEGWVSWGRVMLDSAKKKTWPHSAWGIINLGLVK